MYKLIKSIMIDWIDYKGSIETKEDWLSQYWLDIEVLWEKYFEKQNVEWKVFTYFFHDCKYEAEEHLKDNWIDEELAKDLRWAFEEIEVEYTIENNEIKFLSIKQN